jgi:hypothetical protein
VGWVTNAPIVGLRCWNLLQLIEEQTLRAFPQIAWKVNNTFHTYHSARRWFELVHDVLADADKLLYNQSRLAMSCRISRVFNQG